MNKLIRLHRKHAHEGLYFPPLEKDVTLVTFTDASWACRKDHSSQGGQITLLMEKSVLQGSKTPFHVISWSSRKLKRVARSSTSAESQMCANALDLQFCKLSFLEMESKDPVSLRNADQHLQSLPSCLVVDAKNIYDGIVKIESSGLQLEEKRTAIELLAIKQRLRQAAIALRWVNSDQQLSDALTKSWQHEGLIRALQEGKWRIVFDPSYQSAKRVRALKRSNQDETWDLACEVPKAENLSMNVWQERILTDVNCEELPTFICT